MSDSMTILEYNLTSDSLYFHKLFVQHQKSSDFGKFYWSIKSESR